ncbi:MAG: tetratricopeptide repeat protein [Opitutales bacterium]
MKFRFILERYPVFSGFWRATVVCLGLALTGWLARPVEAPAWKVVRAKQPEIIFEELESALGQGLVVGMLGGFRTILADFTWIRLYAVWEKKEQEKLDPLLRLTTTLDPESEYFWLNGARMLAYDVPAWRIQAAGGYEAVTESEQKAINREQAEQAFRLLEKAREYHPDNPRMYLEVGQIYMNRLEDPAAAADWFLKAWEKPDAPYFAARIHAELLRRQGKNEEAYAFYRDLYAELPDGDPRAMKNVVLERIRELETILEMPAGKRYRPGR